MNAVYRSVGVIVAVSVGALLAVAIAANPVDAFLIAWAIGLVLLIAWDD